MRQQIELYLERLWHPDKDGLKRHFSSFLFSQINIEQLIIFKYFKDLIFISGLFFELNIPTQIKSSEKLIVIRTKYCGGITSSQVNSYANEK